MITAFKINNLLWAAPKLTAHSSRATIRERESYPKPPPFTSTAHYQGIIFLIIHFRFYS